MYGRMPMHDIFWEGALVIYELVSDPELRLVVLEIEGTARHKPRVDENAQIVLVGRRQRARPVLILLEVSEAIFVGSKRRIAAIGEKLRYRQGASAAARHHLLVIAAQTHGPRPLQMAQQPHDLARGGTAVDIVAEKDELRRLRPSLFFGIFGDVTQQPRELLMHSVNIADRDRDHCPSRVSGGRLSPATAFGNLAPTRVHRFARLSEEMT